MSKYPAPEMVPRVCIAPGCHCQFQARKADVKRGWGLFCSKKCKANNQTSPGGRGRVRQAQSQANSKKSTQLKVEAKPVNSFDEWDKIVAAEDALKEK